jgi:hypothetical protein
MRELDSHSEEVVEDWRKAMIYRRGSGGFMPRIHTQWLGEDDHYLPYKWWFYAPNAYSMPGEGW